MGRTTGRTLFGTRSAVSSRVSRTFARDDMKADRSEWYVPADWLFHLGCLLMIPLSLLAGLLVPAISSARRGDLTLFILSLALSLIGVVLLFLARLPLYRQRRFFTIGSAVLPESHRRIYRVAWRFIASGLFIMVLLNVLMRL